MSVKLILFLSLEYFSPSAIAGLSFSRNARTFETQHSTLVMKGLAHSCLTMSKMPDGLPCNPAMTPLIKKPSLGAEILLSNGYSALESVKKLLDGKISQELVDSLVAKDKIIQIESNVDINFQSNYFNAQYMPLTIKSFSVVRNEANPDIELYAVEENGFLFQKGYAIFSDLFAGIQARFVNRKFIRKQFKLISLGTQEGRDFIHPKTQIATYIEPGITWFFEKLWRPRISLFLANAGFLYQSYEDLKIPTEAQFGFGISPPIDWGDLELSLEYRSMNYEETSLQKIRFGTLYHFGSMYLMGGIDANGVSGGVYYGLDQINAGIMYSTTRYVNNNDNYFTQTVYVQLGWQI